MTTSINLRDFGSFFVGGQPMTTSGAASEAHVLAKGGVPVTINPNGTTMLGQMYVQYALVDKSPSRPPIAFWHGGSLTGATWETTPDGRDGWLQYFLRRGWSCYNVDAVERGRSGWSPRDPHFNDRPILRTAQDSFHQFRLGRRCEALDVRSLENAAYPQCRFPLAAFPEFLKQVVPRWSTTDDLALAAYDAFLDRVGPVIIVAHSQGAAFALKAAERRPDKVAGIVAIEPAQGGETDGSVLEGTPVLAIYGDHLELDPRWPSIRARTDTYFASALNAGADISVVDLPQRGITGNSHMMMMETNNGDIAEVISAWLRQVGLDR